MEVKIQARSAEETQKIAGILAECIREALRAPEAATPRLEGVLIGLSGELGAGKTTFVQGFVGALANEALYVTSPTFAIMQQYECDPPVVHMDLYRLGSIEELETVGYRDAYYASGVTLVEWIEQVPDAIPEEWIDIRLVAGMTDVRDIQLRAWGDSMAVLLAAFQRALREGSK